MPLTDVQLRIVAEGGHLLVTGGPGSGKTTVSIHKAVTIVRDKLLKEQHVLFLSFARPSAARVIEAIQSEHQIDRDHRRRILVETYHAFFWRILRTHGYLIGLPRRLRVMARQNEAITLSQIRSSYKAEAKLSDAERLDRSRREADERKRLAFSEGRICFDLFAPLAHQILAGSDRILRLVAQMYPFVILDEFQDTSGDQWEVVKDLGRHSTMLALADPQQRIYDWIGADPERLDHFRAQFQPTEFDLGSDNHRSSGTDICLFGDHLLRGQFREAAYAGVELTTYGGSSNQAFSKLVATTLQARQRLLSSGGRGWSLAILVPTKRMTRLVADALRSPPAGLPPIRHTASVEIEAATLAADLIAFVMQQRAGVAPLTQLVNLLRDFFRGRGGDAPSRSDLDMARRLEKAYGDYLARVVDDRPVRRNSIVLPVIEVFDRARGLALSGNPEADWMAIRDELENGVCPRFKTVADDARNLRLLERGAQLRQALAEDWRNNGTYQNALEIVRQTFVTEHFAMDHRPETGVVVMNMHKAKGKQFDEVIIFDGWPQMVRGRIVANANRIVRGNIRENDGDHARQNLRVSVTRGRTRTTILTPEVDPCILLP